MPNPFAPIDRLDFDFDLPPLPSVLGRADRWFNRLSEVQRIGVVLLVLMLLVAAALYCLGLGSTVLVNRAEAALAAEEAQYAASQPPALVEPSPIAQEPTPTQAPTLRPTIAPSRAAEKPTAVVVLPTPIPAQLLPTVPLQPLTPPRQTAPIDQAPARPRLVAPPEPPTPTPPARTNPIVPAATKPTGAGTTAPAATAVRGTTPAVKPGNVFATPVPTAASRPAATSAPAAKPTVAAPKPTAAPIFTNPIGNPTPATKPSTTR